MAAKFPLGKITGPEDLTLTLVDANNSPVDAYQVSYALSEVTTGVEVPIGPASRQPVHAAIGSYYAAFQIPENANLGLYRIRWTFQETTTSPVNAVMEEFYVEEPAKFELEIYTPTQLAMIRRLRILLRDQNPARNYKFQPPTSESTLNKYNRVFAYIWEDEELVEYMERAVDFINLSPPQTHWHTIDQMVSAKPAWRQMILMGAISHAAMALAFNWVQEEFSLAGDEQVTVTLPGGRDVVVSIEELYNICYDSENP